MRRFAVLAHIALVLAAAAAPAASAAAPQPKTPIKHFITLMQENHSFDNYFGTYPGADGVPKDVCMPVNNTDPNSRCVKPFRLGGRASEDLSHSAGAFNGQLNGGRMDGFITAQSQRGKEQEVVMGHYDDGNIPYYWNVADEFVLFDRFFTSARSGSLTNHMFWVTGGPGNPNGEFIPRNGFDTQTTIFDRLEEKGISWKFYVQNYDPRITFRSNTLSDRGSQVVWVPLLNYPRYIDNPDLFRHIVSMDEFYDDVRHGTLPSVSYLIPSGSSEHPPGSIKAGETFVRTLIGALVRSKLWASSAFQWTYDDWGGWYDHVRPPQVDRFGYGFRAPALLVSPYARRGYIEHATMDFTSILKFIEENWGLRPLTRRDRAATSLMRAFDFTKPPRAAVLLGRERHVPRLPEPRRAAVYVGYSAATLLALVVIAVAAGWDRRRRRPRRRLGGPSKRLLVASGRSKERVG
jgi:phospholipase C